MIQFVSAIQVKLPASCQLNAETLLAVIENLYYDRISFCQAEDIILNFPINRWTEEVILFL